MAHMDNNLKDFFSQKHKKLLNIASVSNIFAWIIFIFFLLSAASKLYVIVANHYYAAQFPYNSTPIATPYFNNLLGAAGNLLHGIFFGLILKGISLGLNMIVETDINYRDKVKEAGREQ